MTGRLCPECDGEITTEIVDLDEGTLDDVVSLAAVEPDPSEYVAASLDVTVRLSCRCSSEDVNCIGSATAVTMTVDAWGDA